MTQKQLHCLGMNICICLLQILSLLVSSSYLNTSESSMVSLSSDFAVNGNIESVPQVLKKLKQIPFLKELTGSISGTIFSSQLLFNFHIVGKDCDNYERGRD